MTRRARPAPQPILFACPRISPQWELGALRALIKPQTKEAIVHKPAGQKLPSGARQRVSDVSVTVAQRLGFAPAIHWPGAGNYTFAAEVEPRDTPNARALALAISRELPGVWLVLGRLFVRDGQFYRRERGYKLNLVPASNVHIARPIRAALNGVL